MRPSHSCSVLKNLRKLVFHIRVLTYYPHGCWAILWYRGEGARIVGKVGIGFPAFVAIVRIVSWGTVNKV